MAELSETAASLRFGGDDLDPTEISRLLGAVPTLCYRKGERRLRPDGQEILCGSGLWMLSAERVRPGNLDRQVAELLAPLSQDLAVWNDLSRRFGGVIFSGLFLESANEGIGLQPQTMLALGSRGLGLDMDLYGIMDDGD
ncbi:DUF4279 domain-containing protein [Bosea sp. NPDC055332]